MTNSQFSTLSSALTIIIINTGYYTHFTVIALSIISVVLALIGVYLAIVDNGNAIVRDGLENERRKP